MMIKSSRKKKKKSFLSKALLKGIAARRCQLSVRSAKPALFREVQFSPPRSRFSFGLISSGNRPRSWRPPAESLFAKPAFCVRFLPCSSLAFDCSPCHSEKLKQIASISIRFKLEESGSYSDKMNGTRRCPWVSKQ